MNLGHTNRQEGIIKNTETQDNGVQSQLLMQCCIGYVIKGTKYIYNDNGEPKAVNVGELYYLSVGQHHVNNVPEENKNFEEILFLYSPDVIGDILNDLNDTYHLPIDIIENTHHCSQCSGMQKYVICRGWKDISHFMRTANHYIKDNKSRSNTIGNQIMQTTLVYLILSNNDCCIKGCILNGNNERKENFQHIVNSCVFVNISIPELAAKCNMSLTSFKNKFKSTFNASPSLWIRKQRLIRSKLLIISSDMPIATIGEACIFQNTSHFIKFFKDAYGSTPASFRVQHLKRNDSFKKDGINTEIIGNR